jgi:hypothetical protein
LLTVPAVAQESGSRALLDHEHAAREFLRKKGDDMDFLGYDWNLNGR